MAPEARRQHDRLPKALLARLLLPHEVVRDPVHGDIWVTSLERAIIDTVPFQRLRGIQQLGPTSIVYPGATHTRFLHSLGTLHVAQQLVDTVQANHAVYHQAERGLMRIDPYCHLLIRLTALLHDVAHIPFGHTLEDEGNIAAPEWADRERAARLLDEDPSHSVVPAIRAFLAEVGARRGAVTRLVEDLAMYLQADDPGALDHPFVVDLISNTLCADLIDYVDRDSYFCGLRERSGDRVVKHLAVLRLARGGEAPSDGYEVDFATNTGKGRAVLLTYRFEHDHRDDRRFRIVHKPEILSEAVDLLRRRFALAQKVYFHRTKLAASAMLIEAVAASSVTLDELYGLTDAEVLQRLADDPSLVTQHLFRAYQERRLYHSVYRLTFKPESDDEWRPRKLWEEVYPLLRQPDWRRQQARYLENMSNLEAGSLVIYCPDRKMNIKQFDMLVQGRPRGRVRPLKDSLDEVRKMEMDAINRRFSGLWSVQVLVDPDSLNVDDTDDERVRDLSALCEGVIGFENDIEALAGAGRRPRQMIEAVIEEWQAEEVVPDQAISALRAQAEGGASPAVLEPLGAKLREFARRTRA